MEGYGALAPFYKRTEHGKDMLNNGWCVLRGAVSPEKSTELLNCFDEELMRLGFSCRFSDLQSCQFAKNMPSHFWGIDACLLPLSYPAMKARVEMRNQIARLVLGVSKPEELISSFDGVMVTYAGYTQKPQINPLMPRLPIDPKKGAGPGHIDQSQYREATAESFQAYLALTPIHKSDMGTCMLVPTGGHTIQSMMSELRQQFPESYTRGPKRVKTIGKTDEGFLFPQEHQDWLFSKGMCRLEKPDMNPGDILIWSSAIPHCGGTYKSDVKLHHPRLGVIAGFAPQEVVPQPQIDKLREIVGLGWTTGQQVIYPSKHGGSFPGTLAKYTKPEDWPQAYKNIKAWRANLKATGKRAYEDEPEDDELTKHKKRMFRSLLGL